MRAAEVTSVAGTVVRRFSRPSSSTPPRSVGPVDREPFRVDPVPGVIRVGAYYPHLHVGGAEVWLRTLLRNLGPSFVPSGVCVERAASLPLDLPGVRITGRLDSLLSSSDTLIAWGVRSLRYAREHFAGPIVYVAHGGPGVIEMGERLAGDATHCVAVSRFCLGSIPELYRSTAVVIANGVESAELPCRLVSRAKLGLTGRIAVGFVGRWVDDKDPFAAARAVASLGPEAVAVYHGCRLDGEADFRRQVAELTGGRCIFRTPAASVAETLAALDAFVHTPDTEGFGLTLCEAWQAGVPVVASLCGVVAECGRADDVAVIVPARPDGPTLAAAVREAMDGDKVAPAKRLVAERFTAAGMGRAWGDFLAATVAEARRSGGEMKAPAA